VPDEVHCRLTARAAGQERSINALATEILDAAADADAGHRQVWPPARAAGLGILRERRAPQLSPRRRDRIPASTKGIGPILDPLLDDERDRT
jgi:plasmid stability protein